MLATAMARGIMFLGHFILVSMISQEHPEEMSLNLAQMHTWTQGRAD